MGRFAARDEPRRLVRGAFNSTTDNDEIQHDLAPGETGDSFGSRGRRTGLNSPSGAWQARVRCGRLHLEYTSMYSRTSLRGVGYAGEMLVALRGILTVIQKHTDEFETKVERASAEHPVAVK